MATIKKIDGGSFSSNGSSTPSLSGWGTGTKCLVAVVTAYSSGGASSITHTVTGGGVTWTYIDGKGYRTRREIAVFEASAVPSAGALTITASDGSGSFAETMWCAFEIAEYDSADYIAQGPNSASVDSTGPTSLDTLSVGTPTGDQITVSIGACEGADVAFAAEAGSTEIHKETGGSDVRSFLVAYSGTDDTPGITWSSSSVGAGLMALRVSDGATGSHDAGGSTVTITDAGDEQFNDGESVTITGTGFGATQGTGRVVISPTDNIADGSAVDMTVTSWADTSVTATMDRGSFAWNTGLYLFVEEDGGASNASGYSVQFVPDVYIRETFIDLAGNAQASEAGLDVMIWRSVPTTPGTPDEYLSAQSLDASGVSAWQITGTGLDPNTPDPIWIAVHKADGSALCTMRKIAPSYE